MHNLHLLLSVVKLRSRSRSRSGEGQEGPSQARSSSENSKLKDLDLSHTINLVFTTLHPPGTLFWLQRGLDKSYEPRMGWYDSSKVGEVQKVDI